MASAWRLPQTLLPEGESADRWIRDGVLTSERVAGAESLPGRFALPGLVDAHAHVALGEDGPDDLAGATARLRGYAQVGVLLVRDVGAPKSLTLEIRPADDLPALQVAGRWHAPAQRFYAPFHDPVEPDELIASALHEIGRGARWVKVIADWREPVLSYDAELLRRLADAVHAAGARLAAHTQWPVARDVVAAGADSIEHGTLLDLDAVKLMAARGTAWTPTINAFHEPLPADATAEQRARRAGYHENVRDLLPKAAALGVPVLAGTDHVGTLVVEVQRLIEFGLTPVQALRAASTAARSFLGVDSFDPMAPADVVTYEDDPREDPEVLSRPAAVVLRGRRIR